MNVKAQHYVANAAMTLLFAYITYMAWGYFGHGRWFPLMAGGLGLLVVAIIDVRLLTGRSIALKSAFDFHGIPDADATADAPPMAATSADADEIEPPVDADEPPGWLALLSLAIFPVPLLVLGTYIGIGLWLPAYLRVIAQLSWRKTIFGTVAALAAIFLLERYFRLGMPESIFLGG